jgi:hypothetical protein
VCPATATSLTVEPEEMAVTRKWFSKHAPMAMNTHATNATIEGLLDAVF